MRPVEQKTSMEAGDLLKIIVRSAGLIALVVGLVLICDLFTRAWSLLDDPKLISKLSVDIDTHSNLGAFSDDLYANVKPHISSETSAKPTQGAPDAAPVAGPTQVSDAPAVKALNLSYFFAWAIVLTVLKICVSLAMSAMKYGAELALHDREDKRLRTLVKEAVEKFHITQEVG